MAPRPQAKEAALSDNLTRPTEQSVDAWFETLEPARRREEARALDALMRRVTGEAPVMWGASLVGYGQHHYRYDSGREGDTFVVGFSPRKGKHVLYLASFEGREELQDRLGKHKTGAACLYVNKLADIDLEVLEEMIRRSVAHTRG